MLRNPASFTGRHIGLTDSVKKGRLPMVNVTHDGNNRGRGLRLAGSSSTSGSSVGSCSGRRFLDFTVEVHTYELGRFMVNFLIDGHHLP